MSTAASIKSRCAVCGAGFKPRSKTAGKRTEACSPSCGARLRGARAAARNLSKCAVCSNEFTPKSYSRTKGEPPQRTRTCSGACGIALRWLTAKKHVSAKACEFCGKEFFAETLGHRPSSLRWRKQRFCGYACVYSSRRKPREPAK